MQRGLGAAIVSPALGNARVVGDSIREGNRSEQRFLFAIPMPASYAGGTMKTHALLAVVVSLLMASCVSPVQRRMERNPELFAKLSAAHKVHVLEGRVVEGMTKDAVFFAWGKPQRVTVGKRNGVAMERWNYMGYEPVYRDELSFGYGGFTGNYALARQDHNQRYMCDYRRYNMVEFRTSPTVDYVPYNAKMVEFVNGVVVAFVQPR